VFSKYPIKDYGTLIDDNSENIFVYADIELYDQIIRVYSLHLASLYLSREDYHLIDNPGENGNNKPLDAFSGILEKMRYAYNKRLSEVKAVSRHAEACKHSVVLCGDFNDVPVSYAYRHFQKQYKDAFKEAGFGLGNTYIRRFVRFRIDYVFLSNSLNVLDFRVIREAYSDHYPVQVVLGF
jgi:endonuclease/exonuclease/phosphatase family metal-dependent hydrolase